MMTKVLAADNDRAVRQMFMDVLSPLCEVILAADGEEARELLLSERPDVAFIDIFMPRLDGLTLTQWARETFPEMAIIIMTGYDSGRAMVDSIRAGADNYLTKPFGAVLIRGLVEEGILRGRRRKELIEREEEFKRSKELAERLIEEAGAIILALDASGKTRICNKTAEDTSGYTRQEILQMGWDELLYPQPPYRASVRQMFLDRLAGDETGQFETEITTHRGDKRFILWNVEAIDGSKGRNSELVAVGVDVTNHRILQQQLEKQARTDPLTRLYNRFFFDEVLTREISRSKRYGLPLSLMMIDLDTLKKVNDRFGHAAGDELLKGTADLLRESVRTADVVARYGGDEFVVLLPHTAEEGASNMARRIDVASRKWKMKWEGHSIPLSLSLGTATGRNEECDRLLKVADTKMYEAKRRKPTVATRR